MELDFRLYVGVFGKELIALVFFQNIHQSFV